MNVLASVVMIATLASVVVGCGSARTSESLSPSEMDRLYCNRSNGIWRATLDVCEYARR